MEVRKATRARTATEDPKTVETRTVVGARKAVQASESKYVGGHVLS